MSGRVYDARLGRFLQADPYIQFSDHTQNYSRYTYVHNNPLNATDPSGNFIFTLPKEAKFNHYWPSRYFSENIDRLKEAMSDDTLARFRDAFKVLNSLLD